MSPTWNGQWLALLSFSAAACGSARRADAGSETGISATKTTACTWSPTAAGFDLLEYHVPNLASRVLALAANAAWSRDWPERFGPRRLALETFVDPRRFHGPTDHAANGDVGDTRGYRRTRSGYRLAIRAPPSALCLRPCTPRASCCRVPYLDPQYRHGAPENHVQRRTDGLSAGVLADIPPTPRRGQGRRHPLPAAPAIAAGAT